MLSTSGNTVLLGHKGQRKLRPQDALAGAPQSSWVTESGLAAILCGCQSYRMCVYAVSEVIPPLLTFLSPSSLPTIFSELAILVKGSTRESSWVSASSRSLLHVLKEGKGLVS